MPCGKKRLVKSWDKPKVLRVITPSRYEQNEPSVKMHWKNVIKDLEQFYKDDKFWESNCDTVRELVGPVLFQRMAKIFDLPLESTKYEVRADVSSIVPSEQFYIARMTSATAANATRAHPTFSISNFEGSLEEEEEEEMMEEESQWTLSSSQVESKMQSRSRSIVVSKALIKSISGKLSSFSYKSKTMMRSMSSRKTIKSEAEIGLDETPRTSDDLDVLADSVNLKRHTPSKKNPFFTMLYCNESETDMIKWKSKYKQKGFEVSASDEFSKRAEIMTKKIAKEFYDWWVGLGNVEFKSEIKRPEDIEELFQVWFDEHASRGLVLNPKILPCVLQSIADYIGVSKASCPKVLKRQIAYDIHAETSPAHTMAFGTCLPHKMKHLPPRNNTKQMWYSVKIPEDLRSMAAVWEDIQHLTSTKEFQKWLAARPQMPMPPCLKQLGASGDKKQLFVVPSDFVTRDRSTSSSAQDLALPVSQFSLELKEVLSKLMKD